MDFLRINNDEGNFWVSLEIYKQIKSQKIMKAVLLGCFNLNFDMVAFSRRILR